ncbi:thiamine phosphate synthase [Hyphomicrobium methylovorum]|uniref:thiamine phosphate synthase n=1 Tax=Hyphomicrobium methylovorum TaxID=84 RepID=UPI0015E7DD92|nr:thiamine phosphate synthase [Hyphomicrobium methylovorum]
MSRDARLYIDFAVGARSLEGARDVLSHVFATSPIASVLLRFDGSGLNDQAKRELVALVQSKDAAALVLSDPGTAVALSADGVHIPWSEEIGTEFANARRSAAQDAIVGADAGRTRHDAMELGENGADYVAFGVPPHVGDRVRAAERQIDLVSWWSELFEIPCAAFDVTSEEHARNLFSAGADFVTLTIGPDDSVEDAVARAKDFAAAAAVHEDAQ